MQTTRWPVRIGFAVLAMLGAWLWQGDAMRARFAVQQLLNAAPEERDRWRITLADRGAVAGARTLAACSDEDAEHCEILRATVAFLADRWGANDAKTILLAEDYFARFGNASEAGQIALLPLLPQMQATLGTEGIARARSVLQTAVKDPSAEKRFRAIAAAMGSDASLLSTVAPLLQDAEPRIRQAAVLALGPLHENGDTPAVGTDELLRMLHDPDGETRRLCERALRSRGLRERDIRLGRLLTHPEPMERLKLLIDLPEDDSLDASVWLHRLSNDSDSAVRAGTARVAAERKIDFGDRLEQMSKSDADGTVRRIAEHYRKGMR